MYIPHFAYLFDLGCFYILAMMNNEAVNMDIQICLGDPAFNSLGYLRKMKLLDHMVNPFLIL